MKRKPIICTDYTEEELLNMSKAEATKGLTEQHQRFCEAYVEGHNYKTALVRAGYKSENPSFLFHRFVKKDPIKLYINWLKARTLKQSMLSAYDIIDEWIRIAFADMTDFVEIYPHSIKLKPADQVDGQLIKSIKSGRDGISVELHDKMKALDKLANYCDDFPKEWKQKLEERRLDLLEREFELKKQIYEKEMPEREDDGLIKMLKKSAKVVWESERESIDE